MPLARGKFELCPADACCNEGPEPIEQGTRFEISGSPDLELAASLERFLATNGIEVAGIEYIRRSDGTSVIYDINTNTNYNAGAEAEAGLDAGGMQRIAEFLAGELANQENALEAA